MEKRTQYIRFRLGALLVVSLVCAGGGAMQMHRWIRADRIAGARQEIRTQVQALGAVTQTGLETLTRELVLVMDEKLRKGEGAEFDREILDISLWTRKDGTPKPARQILGLNSNYITPLQDSAIRSKGAEEYEARRIEPAFDGKWVISGQLTTELGSSYLVAVPASRATPVREVVVAHVRAGYFQRFFKVEAPYQAVLISPEGRVIIGTGASDTEAKLGRAVRAADAMGDSDSGVMDLEIAGAQTPWWSAYRRITPQKFAVVLATSPKSAVEASTIGVWSDVRVWKMALAMFVAAWIGMGVWALTARMRGRFPRSLDSKDSSKLDQILNAREDQIVASLAVTSEPASGPSARVEVMIHPEMTEPEGKIGHRMMTTPIATESSPVSTLIEPVAEVAVPVVETFAPEPPTFEESAPEPVVEPAAELQTALPGAEVTETMPDAVVPPALTGDVEVQPPITSAPDQLWWVHNGANAIGPLVPADIAGRLFAQDLDFDCECWPDGGDESVRLPIASSGLFLPEGVDPNDGVDRPYWVFVNGLGILGPCTTEEAQGLQVPEDSYVCNRTTIQGWMPIADWRRRNDVVEPQPVAPVEITVRPRAA